jgi:hypothetical protein
VSVIEVQNIRRDGVNLFFREIETRELRPAGKTAPFYGNKADQALGLSNRPKRHNGS